LLTFYLQAPGDTHAHTMPRPRTISIPVGSPLSTSIKFASQTSSSILILRRPFIGCEQASAPKNVSAVVVGRRRAGQAADTTGGAALPVVETTCDAVRWLRAGAAENLA
jgi:hypothetical protein